MIKWYLYFSSASKIYYLEVFFRVHYKQMINRKKEEKIRSQACRIIGKVHGISYLQFVNP